MPAPCSLLLEVFLPLSLYDETFESVDWEVSSDPAHPTPYLLAPKNYAEQEVDPVRCTASIGTVDVGVIDVPTVEGEQGTGWMTARVQDLLGRRCRLSRWIDDTIGWVTIADGPAGPPKMDSSYAAYRWSIRDTREVERKLRAFQVGGVCAIVPRGPIYGFGQYTDDTGPHTLLPRVLDVGFTGVYLLEPVGARMMGLVNLAHYFSGGGLDDVRLVMDDAAQTAVQIGDISTTQWGCRTADVLWRLTAPGSPWNVARPISPSSFRQPFVGTAPAVVDGNDVIAANYVTLFLDDAIPDGFPTENGIDIEVVIRYRGPASTDFPYYVEGHLGDVLQALYDRQYSIAPLREIEGIVYDPASMDGDDNRVQIQYDIVAMSALHEHVMLRKTEPVDDARSWAEDSLYGPSGWMPTLDNNMAISPINRAVPSSISSALVLNDSVAAPSSDWQTGHKTVSGVSYTYPRYFLPSDPATEVGSDLLATRDVTLEFHDEESELRYGPQLQEYDASAFAAVGTDEGITIPGQIETASLLCQAARFDVLARYRAGSQSIGVTARRNRISSLRAGDWVPWSFSYLPDRFTGLRGSVVSAAQIISLRDDDCVWRTLLLEESPLSDGPPGQLIDFVKTGDVPDEDASAIGLRNVVITGTQHQLVGDETYELWIRHASDAWALIETGTVVLVGDDMSFAISGLIDGDDYTTQVRLKRVGRYRVGYLTSNPDSWPEASRLEFVPGILVRAGAPVFDFGTWSRIDGDSTQIALEIQAWSLTKDIELYRDGVLIATIAQPHVNPISYTDPDPELGVEHLYTARHVEATLHGPFSDPLPVWGGPAIPLDFTQTSPDDQYGSYDVGWDAGGDLVRIQDDFLCPSIFSDQTTTSASVYNRIIEITDIPPGGTQAAFFRARARREVTSFSVTDVSDWTTININVVINDDNPDYLSCP